MKAAVILLALPLLAAALGDPVERHAIVCRLARPEAVRRAVDCLARDGWAVTSAAPELGVVAAEYATGQKEVYRVALSATGDSLRIVLVCSAVTTQGYCRVPDDVRNTLVAHLVACVATDPQGR